MNRSTLKTALAVLALVLGTSRAMVAQEDEIPAHKAKPKVVQPHPKKKKAVVPDSQRVDINSASKEELMKLKGVTATDADRIIQGRPYKTKAHLITHNVIQMTVYSVIKDRIIARQDLKSLPKPAPKPPAKAAPKPTAKPAPAAK